MDGWRSSPAHRAVSVATLPWHWLRLLAGPPPPTTRKGGGLKPLSVRSRKAASKPWRSLAMSRSRTPPPHWCVTPRASWGRSASWSTMLESTRLSRLTRSQPRIGTDPPLASKRRRSYGKPDESGVRSRRCGTGMVHTKERARHGYRPSGAPAPLHLPRLGYSGSAARHLSLAAYADGCVSRDQHPGSDSRLVL